MMNKLTLYQADAFTNHVFGGNPAAVCVLNHWLASDLMQKIAAENNLSETAFLVKEKEQYHIRWFTPSVEVDLCGHATLAAAHILFEFGFEQGNEITFFSQKSGILRVERTGDLLTLDFPSDEFYKVPVSEEILASFDLIPFEAYRGKTDYMIVFESESEVKSIIPDFVQMAKIDCRGIIVTAKGTQVDFVSRFFGPKSGVNEDPVTGSAHTTLTPYWSRKLDKTKMKAKQVSEREGDLEVEDCGDRVKISGRCITYLKGEIFF
ncbi:MAG: PhzF family phenazine biosynthesis protein [Pelobium sp.]